MAKPKSPTAGAVVGKRKEFGWSQQELAERLHAHTGDALWTRNRVKRLENGALTVDVDVLQALTVVLQLDLATLVYGVGRRGSSGKVTGEYGTQRVMAGHGGTLAQRTLVPAFATLTP